MAWTPDSWEKVRVTRQRLEKCWELDINWSLYNKELEKGCKQVAKALNMPPTAVLSGYITLGSFILSPAVVHVPQKAWTEPVLIWSTVAMPTGSGKSTLFRYLFELLNDVRKNACVPDDDPSWVLDDASFEKMGALMHLNGSRILGLYDELSAFLAQINLYKGRSLSDSHELSLFLQLFNGHPWKRDTVSGDANFKMKDTRLTIGGFTQPGVARNIIDMPSNAEKGLSHRFVWLFPRPVYAKFDSLEEVEETFHSEIVNLLAEQWRKAKLGTEIRERVFKLPTPVVDMTNDEGTSEGATSHITEFAKYYDHIQENLEAISCFDGFLAGLLSKSRGHVIRVAAVLHLLFHLGKEDPLPEQIEESTVKAAVDFIKVSTQQTAYVAGKGLISEEVDKYKTGFSSEEAERSAVSESINKATRYTLTLPGRKLYLTPLLTQKKFRNYGNKEGAVKAFYKLESEGLGKTHVIGNSRCNPQYEFTKEAIPEERDKRVQFIQKLSKYNISLTEYDSAYNLKDIKPFKRLFQDNECGSTSTRKSPRLTPTKNSSPQK